MDARTGGRRGGSEQGRGRGRGSALKSPATVSFDFEKKLRLVPEQKAPISAPEAKNLAPPLPPAKSTPPASSKAVVFAQRPGFGTVGARARIKANHFLVELSDRDLHHYDVSVTPEVTSRGLNRAVMRELLKLQGETNFNGRKPAYDGRKGFYTAGPLPFTSKDFVVKLIDKDEAGSIRKEREFKVKIKLASKTDLHHLREFLQGRLRDAPHEVIQVLDVVLRESPSNNCKVVGRSFFSSSVGDPMDIGNGVQCWKGFYQSLRPTQMGMSLNMDVSATSFYTNTFVTEFVEKFLNLRDMSRATSRPPLSESDCLKLRKVLKGIKVEVAHGQSKCYKISKLSTEPTNRLTFTAEDGSKKSVVVYFQEKYGIKLRYGSWPSLQSGSESKPIYLPMETCKIVEGQRYVKKLNERQVTALLREACKRPSDREKNIQGIVNFNSYEKDALAQEFGIYVKNELTYIDARVLPPPILKYHDSGRDRTIRPRVGQWNMISAKMFHGATVKFWRCMNFSSLPEHMASVFCNDLVGMCRNKGMVINPNPTTPLLSVGPYQIGKALVDAHDLSSREGKPLQLLIIILPDVSGSYGLIKRMCETELGIITQCCQPKQARKCNPQYLENVALKINVKTGGRNTVLDDAINRRIPLLSDCPTIIFGADVSHPQPGEDSSASIAAVVASMDWPAMTVYRGMLSAQQHREEIIQDLYKREQDPVRGPISTGMIKDLMIAFKRSTNQKPRRIIFYRDGVSEGQFSQVLLHEMDAIRKACASLEENYQPSVTFVVVQKRHHTRLFPTNPSETDRSGNILPGTVVDTKICHPTEYDFYLCSHAGIQGTSRPVHYHVLYDENKFMPDALQTLTNNLCYTYARCTRSVSVVPPAYYAHLAAFRARYYMEGDGGAWDSEGGFGSGVRKEAAPVRPLPSLSPNVQNFMFYC